MQIDRQEHIVSRAVFYAAQTIVNFGEKGPHFDYSLAPIITVVLMNFTIFDGPKFIRRIKLREEDGKAICEALNFVFVELPKFQKTLDELKNDLDRGLYALRHIEDLQAIPENFAGSNFELLFRSANLARLASRN